MSSNQLKCVKVSYEIDDCFKIPKHINLEDEKQVKWWGVKWNILHIYLTNGEKLQIQSEGWGFSFDFKHPCNTAIVDAAEMGIDDDEEEEEEDEKVCEDCNETINGETFTYCVMCLCVNVCEPCYNKWKANQ